MAKKFKSADIETGLTDLFRTFMGSAIALCSFDKKMKELNYIKKSITMPDGGIYLISILHIDGPKFDMEQYRQVAESQETELKEQNNEPDQSVSDPVSKKQQG
jgi:hypothetical protein